MDTKLPQVPWTRIAWGVTAFLCVGVALFSYRWLGPPNASMAPAVLANLFAKPWLVVHVAGAATALLVVGFQLLPALRRRRALHRWLGRVYAAACIVGGASGLVVAVGTTAGPVAAWGFGLLAVAWLYTTSQGWLTARARRFDLHREWMLRSFALTFAAVTLRLYLPIAQVSHIPFEAAYPVIAWLCWVPNLVAAELYLRRDGLLRRQMA
ncbi:DUF2306 domain-containing protein [uncultured Phenylobacterium sp.]|uniref:DUF2306 domain-containing protein n=1 Tax=uncultured Phenylobacterium sp. TaxID=349273 RepID=UPI0025FAF5C9|nr:DUF2306 domain-containing protein [uncultured Phenylobacterium sp.]